MNHRTRLKRQAARFREDSATTPFSRFLRGWAMRRVGTKAAGNHLDGRQHLEFPQL